VRSEQHHDPFVATETHQHLAPELAVLAVLDAALVMATGALEAVHQDPDDHGREARVARRLQGQAECMRRTLGRYVRVIDQSIHT
jgi:hypothetical protein